MSFPRALTDEEYRVVRWMIENGDVEPEEYLGQLRQAKVVSQCSCGCASIDFQVGDQPVPPPGPLQIISDYLYGPIDPPFGAFVFAREGILAGFEVYSFADAPAPLPKLEELRRFDEETT